MMGNAKDNMTKHNSVKDKLIDVLQVFILLFSVLMGFFFIYAFVWFVLDLPVTHWVMVLLVGLAGLTEFGYFWWVRKG